MNRQIFYQILRNFEKEHLKGFRSYLKRNEPEMGSLVALWDYVRRFYPDFNEQKLDPGRISKKFYGKETPASRKLVLNQFSNLYGHLKAYLISVSLKNTPALEVLLEYLYLKEFGIQSELANKLEDLEKVILEKNVLEAWDYLLLSRLYEEQLEHVATFSLLDHFKKIHTIRAVLAEGYLATQYKFKASLGRYQNFLASQGLEGDPIQRELGQQKILSKMYKLCYKLEINKEKTTFDELEKLLIGATKIPIKDKYLLLTFLLNYVSHKIREGSQDAFQKAFELYTYGLESTILLQESGITPDKFANIISIGCYLKKFDWTLRFIDTYYTFLPEAIQIQYRTYSLAMVRVENNEPEKAIEILKKSLFVDSSYNMRARLLYLRALYSRKNRDEEELLHECRNFRLYLNRNRSIKGDNKMASINFITTLADLVKRNRKKEDIAENLSPKVQVFHRDWLKKQLASYRKR